MIKYETIISNFDDKTTLYNWLRKVEEALKHASATNFVVNKKGNATLSFSITFADGTTLESGDIVLQQGESVDGARIASGVLQLHLTNGTWLTAGNLGAVTNFEIDASQHLIVNYQDGTSQDLGAIFNGNVNISGTLNATKVTGDEIVENMTGYEFATFEQTGFERNFIYAGVCKNGNKLTLVVFLTIKRTSDTFTNDICKFRIPKAVGNKLFPDNSLGPNILSLWQAQAYSNLYTKVDIDLRTAKSQSTDYDLINFSASGLGNLTLDTLYNLRFEQTFLLSDNLAQ